MQAYSGGSYIFKLYEHGGGVYAKAVYGNNFLRLTHFEEKVRSR